MKKTLLVVLLVVLCATPLFAAQKNGLSLGLNLGYPGVGVAVKYDMDKFDIVGTVNYDFKGGLGFDASASYAITDFDIEGAKFYVTGGAGAYFFLALKDGGRMIIGPEAFIGVSYYFKDIPLSLYLRGTAGYGFYLSGEGPGGAFIGGGSLGALYKF